MFNYSNFATLNNVDTVLQRFHFKYSNYCLVKFTSRSYYHVSLTKSTKYHMFGRQISQ